VLEVFDEDKEFYVINDRVCMYKRSHNWRKEYKNDIEGQLRTELDMTYVAIVIANDTSDLKDIESTCVSLYEQSLPPDMIIVIRTIDNKVIPSRISKFLQSCEHYRSVKKWDVRNTINRELTVEKLIDNALENIPFTPKYYVVMEAIKRLCPYGKNIPKDLISTVNEKILKHGLKFSILRRGELSIIHFPSHETLSGNRGDHTLLEKVEHFNPNMVVEWEVPSC
jgi:hypothetical protein